MALFGKLFTSPAPKPCDTNLPAPSTAERVGQFYDDTHEQFLSVYGDVIQAFRTRDVTKLLDYQIESIGFQEGQHALDAGCGVCGPAIYFAQNAGITIEALTISQTQAEHAQQRIQEQKLGDVISVQQGDYHHLPALYEPESFDVVYFLESFGHAQSHQQVIHAAWQTLRPGGTLYIKDLFKKDAAIPAHAPKIAAEIDKINHAYHYNISDLYEFLGFVRKQGFILQSLKTVDLGLEDFENLTISNDFQELTGIGKIANWDDYIFPVDFFEARCMKPVHDIQLGNSRYFLQNLYHLKVLKTQQQDL